MTVIAAVARDGHVIMGADRLTNYGGTGVFMSGSKIRRIPTKTSGEEVMIAASGHGGMLSVIVRELTIDAVPLDEHAALDVQGWADAIASAVTELMASQCPPLTANEDRETSINGALLLGWRGHLFYLFTHTAIRVDDGVACLGIGGDLALGVLHASLAFEVSAGEAVDLAVRVACRFMDGCGIDERGPDIQGLAHGQAVPPAST